MFSFRDISRKKKSFTLLHTDSPEDIRFTQDLTGLEIKDIDQLLSDEFREELRVVRRILTGEKAGE